MSDKTIKEYKDLFELAGVPSFNQFYYYGIFVWKLLYKGFYAPWHLLPINSIAPPMDAEGKRTDKRHMYRTNLPKAACAELAGLIWGDKCKINVNAVDFEPTEEEKEDKLQRYIDHVLAENNFSVKMQEATEQMLALGGEALKVWYEEKHDEDGNPIPGSGKIKIGYCMADQFIPLSWDNAKVTEGVFISRIARDGYYYTRLEWHRWNGETYVISNELYKAEIKPSETESQDILGIRVPLETVYEFLNESVPIEHLDRALFSYMRTPIANNLDDNSPLGVSIYGNAMETLHALDIAYDSLVSEFRLGKKRIIVPASAIKTVVDKETGQLKRFFDATDEVYEALAMDEPESNKIIDNSVELRIEEHVEGMNALLNVLCLQLGFSTSTFSFDTKGGLKTATEVISENSKTFKTIKNCQNCIEPALYDLIYNIFAVARLYDVEFEGEKVSSWFSESEPLCKQIECGIFWDDGVIQDRQTNINEGVNLVANGLMSKTSFLINVLGMTEEQAAAELERINNEGQTQAEAVDRFNSFAEM